MSVDEGKTRQLLRQLAHVGPGQFAHWSVDVFKPTISVLNKKYWWNPFGRFLAREFVGILTEIKNERDSISLNSIQALDSLREKCDFPLGVGKDFFRAKFAMHQYLCQAVLVFDEMHAEGRGDFLESLCAEFSLLEKYLFCPAGVATVEFMEIELFRHLSGIHPEIRTN